MGHTRRCRQCVAAHSRKWYQNRDRERTYNIRRRYHLRRQFGITPEEYDALLKEQGGVCAICKKKEIAKNKSGKPFSLSVDHCHRTGKNRGILCNNCNRGIGHLQEDLRILLAAADYLIMWGEVEDSAS